MVLIFYLAPAEYFCIMLENSVDNEKTVLYTGTQQGSGRVRFNAATGDNSPICAS